MSDFDQDIIRRVRIETNVDTNSIKQASSILNNFYKKYQSNSMKVDTSDFFQAIDAIRVLRKELDATIKNSPHMEGIIGQMSKELGVAEQQFEKTMVRFTNGDIVTGLNEAVSKIVSGLSIQAVDLGDFLSTIKQNAQDAVDSLNGIGALRVRGNDKFLNFDGLNIEKMNQALSTMNDLISAQKEMDNFYGNSLKSSEYYSTYTTESLSKLLSELKDKLNIIEKLGLNDDQLFERRVLKRKIPSEAYDQDFFNKVKLNAIQDKEQYDTALSYLKEYIYTSENLINDFKNNSQLFTNDEFSNIVENITYNIDRAKLQFQELQQIRKVNVESPVKGDFSEITKVLEEIKTSLQIISNMFENENASMRQMAENGVTSFKSLSEAIVSVYTNLSQVQSLVDVISKKDFNITSITQTGGAESSLQAMIQQMAKARETMEHLRQLYDQAGDTLQGLGSKGQVELVMEYSKQLQELNITDISKSVKKADTEMKLASVIAEMEDYIEKLTQINKLRNQYGLGEWKDTFVSTQKPVAKSIVQQKPKVATSQVSTPQAITSTSNTEAQQMWQLKAAIDEVSNAIGRKNAGFIKEQEVVNTSVEAEKAKLKELVGVLTTDISGTLEGLRKKFTQSFVVPELDKNALQTSFDEIYNKFVELKEKIGSNQIDFGINTANITTAIQEALYAKEIASKYRKAEFYDLFDFDLGGTWGNNRMIDLITGEVLNNKADAKSRYDSLYTDYFIHKDSGRVIGNMSQVIQDFISRININTEQEQDDWTQVIVEAINTQGGKIVESIKLLIPKSITDNVDEGKLIDAFNTLTDSINKFLDNTAFGSIEGFLELLSQDETVDKNFLKRELFWYDNKADVESFFNSLSTLGLITDDKVTFTMPKIGGMNSGIAIGDKLVYHTTPQTEIGDVYELMKKQNQAYELGAQIPRIIAAYQNDKTAFQLQTKAVGNNFREYPESTGVWDATDEQIDRLLYTFEMLEKSGLVIEFGGDNVLYDKNKGFSLIDIGAKKSPDHWDDQDTADGMLQSFLRHLGDIVPYDSDGMSKKYDLIDRFKTRSQLSTDQRLVNADTIAAEKATIQKSIIGQNTKGIKITPTMDDGAVAKAVADNVAKTPAIVKITPVVDDNETQNIGSYDTDTLINKYIDAARQSDPSSKIKDIFEENPLLKAFNEGVNGLLEEDLMFSRLNKANDEELKHFRNKFKNFVNGTGSDTFAYGPASEGIIEAQKAVDAALESKQAMDVEGQEAVDVAKQFVDAANAKKEFVEANKLVAQSADESAELIKKEYEAIQSIDVEVSDDGSTNKEAESHKRNTEAIREEAEAQKELTNIKAREKDVYGDKFYKHEDVYKRKKDGAIVKEKVAENVRITPAGKVTTIIKTIIKDFEKFNKEEKKTEENIARAQSKLDEFIKKFKNKTGGNAQFIEGFDELSNFKINKDNIEDVLNKMTDLQAKYNELEGNFRKGQASLNPFTNAITKASNIDNIFGEVEDKFKALSDTSALEEKFNKLQELSQQIKNFVDKINTAPDTITSQNFTDFSKQVGEFNLLKTQLEGSIKRQGRAEAIDAKEQAKAYAEILRLVKERNKFLATAENADKGSIKQRNALMDAYKVEQQLHILGKQIVLTDQQRAELARVREEQARKIRDIEADIATKNANQRDSAKEKIRAKAVEDYINLIKQKNEYELKAAKGGAMQSVYEKKVNELKEKIAQNDKQSIMNQEEKNKLTAIEVKHQEKLSELKSKQDSLNNFQKQNDTIRSKFDAGYLSEDSFKKWQNNLSTYQSYLDGTVSADEETIKEEGKILTQLYDQLIKASNKTKAFYSSGGQILSKWFNSDEIKNAEQSLQELYKSIASDRFGGMKTAITGVNGEIGKLTFTVDNGKGSLASYSILLDKSTGATKLLGGQTKETLTTLQKFGSALKGDVRGLISAFIGGMSTLYTVGRYIREGIQSVKELDAALTELRKVTDETEATYDKFLQTAGKTSARIGSTLTNMTSATAEFAKLG